MRGWLAGDPQLAYLKHYVDNLFRKQAHVRSAEVEELLGSLAAPFANVEMTASMLTDSDFKFPGATGSDGSTQPVTQGTLGKILAGADREARRVAWEGYMDTYLAYKNTLAANLLTSVKYNVFSMRARRHASTLEMALAEHNTPVEVFHNLIATFRKNLPTWQRYWAMRRKALGVDMLQPYDIWAPLTGSRPQIPYEQAVEWICDGLAPMGEDYVATRPPRLPGGALGGCLSRTRARWPAPSPSGCTGHAPVHHDELHRRGLQPEHAGARARPFDALVPDLAEPAGASTATTRMFVAEVASNFHQAMVRAHLLDNDDRPGLPDRGDRRGDVELPPLLLHHAHAGALRAGDAPARSSAARG